MWQRFSAAARKVVFYAQEEAQKFGEGYVSTEHLLLGIVRDPDCTGCRILTQVGVSPSRVRTEVEKQLPRGDARPSQDMTLTPRAKRVIDLSYEEARGFSHNYIGTEHILLGLVREGDGLAGRVLAKLGVELEAARAALGQVDGEESESGSTSASTSANAATALLARKQPMAADLVCLMFLFERSGPVQALIERVGVDVNILGTLIGDEVLAVRSHADSQMAIPSCTEITAQAAEEAKQLGQDLTGAHFILAAVTHEETATARSLSHFGVGYDQLKSVLSE